MTNDRKTKLLTSRSQENCLRVLRPASSRSDGRVTINGRNYYDFCSNDYLGLSDHVALKNAAIDATDQFGCGSSASRLLSGDYELFHELEAATAKLKNKAAALVLNSGYQANIGVISALCGPKDLMLADKLSHASIIDAAAQSGAKLLRFRHNDTAHLKNLLQKAQNGITGSYENITVVTESVFSMDGDIAPLAEIAALKRGFNFTLIVDEAHATGIFGQTGGGLCSDSPFSEQADIVIGTFGKALGSFGAYVACDEITKQFLINACRSFIYSTALPPGVIAANIAAIELIELEPERRSHLLENAEMFRNRLNSSGIKTLGQSQIVPVILPESILDSTAVSLRDSGYWVLPIKPPTVAKGSSRLRFSLSYDHSTEILTELADRLIEIVSQKNVIK